MTDMVKAFGCRPTQAVGRDSGRRTETAHVRTRGPRVVCYGDLRISAVQRLRDEPAGVQSSERGPTDTSFWQGATERDQDVGGSEGGRRPIASISIRYPWCKP